MIPQEIIWIAKTLILPPGGLLVIAFLGLIFIHRVRGKLLIVVSMSGFYLLSTGFISGQLIKPLEHYPALTKAQIKSSKAQAILVLCGGRSEQAPDQGGIDTVNAVTLERLRYAAQIARATGLPVIPNGGSPLSDGPSEAALAAQVLKNELGVEVLLVEEQSRTTWENATSIAPILQLRGIDSVFLVTHAWHLPRAMDAFSLTSLSITPAPTAFASGDMNTPTVHDWLPSAGALQVSAWAIHEYIGRLWYQLKKDYQL